MSKFISIPGYGILRKDAIIHIPYYPKKGDDEYYVPIKVDPRLMNHNYSIVNIPLHPDKSEASKILTGIILEMINE